MTDKKTEALKLALKKAFDLGKRYWQQANSDFTSQWRKADVTLASFNQLVEDTIREALAEQPAQQDQDQGQSCYCPNCEALSKELAALKAQQQPVAQCTASDVWNCKYCLKNKTCAALNDPRNFAPPQPAQPSKPWVGLTDEERDAILDREFKQWWSRHDAVCRAIEAKLREKNA